MGGGTTNSAGATPGENTPKKSQVEKPDAKALRPRKNVAIQALRHRRCAIRRTGENRGKPPFPRLFVTANARTHSIGTAAWRARKPPFRPRRDGVDSARRQWIFANSWVTPWPWLLVTGRGVSQQQRRRRRRTSGQHSPPVAVRRSLLARLTVAADCEVPFPVHATYRAATCRPEAGRGSRTSLTSPLVREVGLPRFALHKSVGYPGEG